MNDKLYFSFLPTRLRVSELGKGTSEEIMEKGNKTNQTSTSIKSNCSQIKSVNWGPSKPERTNSKIHEARQAGKGEEQSRFQAIWSGGDNKELKGSRGSPYSAPAGGAVTNVATSYKLRTQM